MKQHKSDHSPCLDPVIHLCATCGNRVYFMGPQNLAYCSTKGCKQDVAPPVPYRRSEGRLLIGE